MYEVTERCTDWDKTLTSSNEHLILIYKVTILVNSTHCDNCIVTFSVLYKNELCFRI